MLYNFFRVVVGWRLTSLNNIFYIKIKVGKVGPNGTIIGKTKWKKVEEMSIDDIYEKVSIKKYGVNKTEKLSFQDFADVSINDYVYTITDNQKTIFLDSLYSRLNSRLLVTGLRFNTVGNNLRLEARFNYYDPITGKLSDSPIWHYNPYQINRRYF